MLDAIVNVIHRARTKTLKTAFQKLYQRLALIADAAVAESVTSPSPNPATGSMEELSAFLKDQSFGSLDEANLALQNLMDGHNEQPDPEMGGLSPNQVTQLVYLDWDNPDNPIELDDQLSIADLQHVKFLLNTRIFLRSLQVNQGPTVTTKGNLNRKVVRMMLEHMHWPDGYIKDLFKYNKVVNEHDVLPLHMIRVVCECGGLIRKRKTSFRTTRKAEKLIADDQIGALYAQLFYVFFRKFNIAYTDRLPDCPGIQATVAYSLYRLGTVVKNWRSIESLLTDILLPTVRAEIHDSIQAYYELTWPLEKRILDPLKEFGLIECRYEKVKSGFYPKLTAVKITNLFDKFLHFTFRPPGT